MKYTLESTTQMAADLRQLMGRAIGGGWSERDAAEFVLAFAIKSLNERSNLERIAIETLLIGMVDGQFAPAVSP